ncbi:MAG: hypothetical protein IKS48_03995 [Eubacterium sp.]|nr:hypothetical protein [Eubacterium sp.]
MFKYDDFSAWADSVFKNEFPDDTVAICFNLYQESEQDTYSVQIVGARVFDEEDWACDETFSSENNLYIWKEKGGWEKALKAAKKNVEKYVNEGANSETLKAYDGVGIGFVDGDIEIIYRREE